MWISLERDWPGFVTALAERFPLLDLRCPPEHAAGRGSLCAYLARAGDITRSEAEEIVETLVLPRWSGRRVRDAEGA